jgi:hypothetical protein
LAQSFSVWGRLADCEPQRDGLQLDQKMIATDSSGRQVLNTDVALGNGTLDCAAYWSEAHPARWGHLAPPGCTATATISRYSQYPDDAAATVFWLGLALTQWRMGRLDPR